MLTQLFSKFPFFELEQCYLREIKLSDTRDYFSYMSSLEVSSSIPDHSRPKDLDEAMIELRYWRSLFENKKSFFWAISTKKYNQMIGSVGFNFVSFFSRKGEISYDLGPEYWGNGIMKEALLKLIDFSKDIGLQRIQATVIHDNQRSIKLLEACEFKLEGRLEKYDVRKGEHVDSLMYAKLLPASSEFAQKG